MIQKKICVLGSFAVGKTSLTERFVKSIFSDRYKTTVGVHIQKKTLNAGGRELTLIIWDLAGGDQLMDVRNSYLRGSSGYLVVADGTRKETLDIAVRLQGQAEQTLGRLPFLLILNKTDLANEWAIDESRVQVLAQRGWLVTRTSAKEGLGVQESFEVLATKLMQAHETSA